ncbi:uncharacterized protein BO80DRAFT_97045 [Aspergillus ibericus CBS 121593]|uniref:Uncharacterized protein n=1 Tax=Aspergillus ibericus CBS 121593 TaxID=1448316 RepID=A0A395GYH7_9EURO|nr:hypothetical protein BO80DRAFT_97045 [Aspergillus ibericus CBS 121593]RAL00410.1 hypothetical protein BO80DRAFT_97045 [Aspergillus ibericus CBS 121593]
MGQKLSAIHGVKSEDYHKPGNAINEVWLGNVELISRLPFADSDMAQAAWPKGQFPKIPWHNFIIPWKRGTSTVKRAFESSAAVTRETLGNSDKEDLGGALYVYFLMIVVTLLYSCAWATLQMPVYMEQDEPPYRPDEKPRSVVRNRYRAKFTACLISIVPGAILWMLGHCLLNHSLDFAGDNLGRFPRSVINIVYDVPSAYFFVRGLWGLRFFWLRMEAVGEAGDDGEDEDQDESVDAAVVGNQLSGNLVSYMQRQRRA